MVLHDDDVEISLLKDGGLFIFLDGSTVYRHVFSDKKMLNILWRLKKLETVLKNRIAYDSLGEDEER